MALRPGSRAAAESLPEAPSRISWRAVAFGVLLVAYVLLTLGVIFRSPVLSLDTDLVKLDLRHRYPEWRHPILDYVMFGQRGPATFAFLPYFVWVAWRRRSTQPLVLLGTGLVLLNLSVGVVKIATGRARVEHRGAVRPHCLDRADAS
jgi:hypothetical protein